MKDAQQRRESRIELLVDLIKNWLTEEERAELHRIAEERQSR